MGAWLRRGRGEASLLEKGRVSAVCLTPCGTAVTAGDPASSFPCRCSLGHLGGLCVSPLPCSSSRDLVPIKTEKLLSARVSFPLFLSEAIKFCQGLFFSFLFFYDDLDKIQDQRFCGEGADSSALLLVFRSRLQALISWSKEPGLTATMH